MDNSKSSGNIQKLLIELQQLIQANNPDLYQSLTPGVSKEQLDALSNSHNCKIPEELYLLWQWHNGQGYQYYKRFQPQNNQMFISANLAIEVAEELNDLLGYDVSPDNWNSDWIPFCEDGGGNYLCMDSTSKAIYFYDKTAVSTGIRYNTMNEWLIEAINAYK